MWYSISSFSVKYSISAAAEGILWCSVQLQLVPFPTSHLTAVSYEHFLSREFITGRGGNHHDPSISTRERVSHNGPRTLGHVCEIIWAVTPPDKGVINKNHFPAVLQPPRWFLFLLAGCISLRAPLRSVSARPRGHLVIPQRRFHTPSEKKKKKEAQSVCLLWSVQVTLMDGCRASNMVSALWKWRKHSQVCFLTINRGKGIKKLFSVSEITSGTVPVVTGHTHKSASQEELIHFPQNLDFFSQNIIHWKTNWTLKEQLWCSRLLYKNLNALISKCHPFMKP